jgi:hypothetical protein
MPVFSFLTSKEATQDPRVGDKFLLIGSRRASVMVVHNRQLEVIVVTGINFGNFTALLTIIGHQK